LVQTDLEVIMNLKLVLRVKVDGARLVATFRWFERRSNLSGLDLDCGFGEGQSTWYRSKPVFGPFLCLQTRGHNWGRLHKSLLEQAQGGEMGVG
jgi:hypothetical protein